MNNAKNFWIIWATMSENVPSDIFAQRRFWSVCAFAHWPESSLGAFWIAKDNIYSCGQRIPWSDYVNVSLRRAHMSEVTFSHVAARLNLPVWITIVHITTYLKGVLLIKRKMPFTNHEMQKSIEDVQEEHNHRTLPTHYENVKTCLFKYTENFYHEKLKIFK